MRLAHCSVYKPKIINENWTHVEQCWTADMATCRGNEITYNVDFNASIFKYWSRNNQHSMHSKDYDWVSSEILHEFYVNEFHFYQFCCDIPRDHSLNDNALNFRTTEPHVRSKRLHSSGYHLMIWLMTKHSHHTIKRRICEANEWMQLVK